MSNAPDNLVDIRQQIAAHVEGERKFYTIRGFVGAKRAQSYHLGAKDIVDDGFGIYDPVVNPNGDYSTRRKRDKAGLTQNDEGVWTNWASAIDISANPALPIAELKRLLAWMVGEAKAGRLDAQELIGPNADGNATDYRKPLFAPRVRHDPDKNDSHRRHIHWSLPRDLTNPDVATPDLWPMLEGFFGPRIDVDAEPEPEPEPIPEPPPTPEELVALIAVLEEELAQARLDHDGTKASLIARENEILRLNADKAAVGEHAEAIVTLLQP